MNISDYIEHTLLKQQATKSDIKKLCKEAIEHRFAAVCVPPYHLREARKYLEGKNIELCTVIGFPMGYSSTAAKAEEIKRAIDHGVNCVDVVANVSAVLSDDWGYVQNDIETVVTTAQLRDLEVKIIFETSRIRSKDIKSLCEICMKSGANYVKTSTGFDGQVADLQTVKLLKRFVGDKMKIKASGGIRTHEDAMAMIGVGANRLGTSAGVQIINNS